MRRISLSASAQIVLERVCYCMCAKLLLGWPHSALLNASSVRGIAHAPEHDLQRISVTRRQLLLPVQQALLALRHRPAIRGVHFIARRTRRRFVRQELIQLCLNLSDGRQPGKIRQPFMPARELPRRLAFKLIRRQRFVRPGTEGGA